MATQHGENPGIMGKIFDYTIDFLQELGRGSFGTVYKGSDDDGSTVAIKKVSKNDKKKASTEAVKFHFLKEKIFHNHVMKVYDVKTWMDSMWIVMEFCDLGDLNKFFEKYLLRLDMTNKVSLMRQIAKGIAFLHQNNIVHRDIKPGNILLKSCKGYAVVKLGDFGLSKFLDPNDMTSAMSSNVGTLTFKAPEFWDRQPDERVRYHRNIDVYAAGLTFTAMLQAKPDHSLVPKAEGSLESFEKKMPIGFAAFTRCQNNHNEIRVVVQDVFCLPIVNELKSVIETMTYYSPQARISAAEVEKRMDSLTRQFTRTDMELISSFTISETTLPERLCYVNTNLVTLGNCSKNIDQKKIKVRDGETGSLLREWNTCHASSSLMPFEMQAKEYLLEGCTICKVIRRYEFSETTSIMVDILCENITPTFMCRGPDDTILVFDEEKGFIVQLQYFRETFHQHNSLFMDPEYVAGMCYTDVGGTVVVLERRDGVVITGVSLATGKVEWQLSKSEFASEILTLPDGNICVVVNYSRFFVLDPAKRAIVNSLVDPGSLGRIWRVATHSGCEYNSLAILHNAMEQTLVTSYRLSHHYVPLQDIIPHEANKASNK